MLGCSPVIVNANMVELKKIAIADGMITLRQSGLAKVREGVTTLEEVVRETVHDPDDWTPKYVSDTDVTFTRR